MKHDLLDIIDIKMMATRPGSSDISFGEIASMYPEELEIKPAYQRLFRWSETQQSQFIESLILELPIPPIFVIETETGKYELIDGLQRISSFLHFMGLLDGNKTKLKLVNCDIVKELNGLTFDDLSPAIRITIRRSYTRMYIIKKERPKRLKYDMFKRLNTGGSSISAQEVRNSTIRLLDEDFIHFIQEIKEDENFRKSISYITEEQVQQQFDDELVLLFFTLKNANLKEYDGSLADFMTCYAEQVAEKKVLFNDDTEKTCFQKTFEILNKIMPNGDIFTETAKGNHQKQFLSVYFEAFSIAVAQNLDKFANANAKLASLTSEFIKLKEQEAFRYVTKNAKEKRTSGSLYRTYLDQRINAVEKIISDVL